MSLPCARVITVLEQLVAMPGAPQRLRCDNGPEFIAAELGQWCARRGIQAGLHSTGKPNQNAYIERFNRSYRYELPDAWVFTTLSDVRDFSEAWRMCYNTERAHDALGRVPPLTYLPRSPAPSATHFQLCA